MYVCILDKINVKLDGYSDEYSGWQVENTKELWKIKWLKTFSILFYSILFKVSKCLLGVWIFFFFFLIKQLLIDKIHSATLKWFSEEEFGWQIQVEITELWKNVMVEKNIYSVLNLLYSKIAALLPCFT